MNASRHLSFPTTSASQLFDVDNFLADLERLAATLAQPDEFYPQLLEASALAIGADSAVMWSVAAGRHAARFQHPPQGLLRTNTTMLANELEQTSAAAAPRLLTWPGSREVVLACPVHGALGVVGVLTFDLPDGTKSAQAEPLLELAAAVAEIAGDYELRRQVAASGDSARRLASLEAFMLRVYGAWTVGEVARELAEEGRRLVNCDRLSVLIRSGRMWHVAAMSGVDSPSHRSAAVRGMERLVRVVAATGDPLIVQDGPADFSPQVQQAVDDYLDGAPSRQLLVAPCLPPSDESVAVPPRSNVTVVLEQFNGTLPSDCMTRLQTLTDHAAVAVSRAQTLGKLPLAGWFLRRSSANALPGGVRRAVLWLAAIAALGAVAATLAFVPATLEIAAEGRFAPTSRTRVFAPLDAVVQRVLVTHGATVTAGQPLLALRSPQLELEIEQVSGELATTRKEMTALETARLRATLPNQKTETDVGSLAAKLAALRELAASHERRLELLRKEAARLTVVSPIDGEVLSWKPEDYLQDRPVVRGERLLEIAATSAGWSIELDVADRRAGHVLAAAETAEPLSVSYVVKSDPAVRHSGLVTNIAVVTQPDAGGNPVMLVDVRPEDAARAAPRSGMMVAAKIHCGERSLGYVWFHEAWEAIQRYWF
ncbi:MAG: biotin/lipoyl-binding protein [Pirellulales bacterium]